MGSNEPAGPVIHAVEDAFARRVGEVYLDTAAEGLLPLCATEAMDAYLRDKGRGTPGREAMFEEEERSKCVAARLLAARPENVALLPSATDALNLLANSLDWRPGDEVVTTDLEFPSGVLAFLRLRDRGVRLQVVPSRGGAVDPGRLCSAIGPATRVVVLSQVSYKTGTNMGDISAVAAEARRRGALVCVDATQAMGRVPVSMEGVDLLTASSYKWLLGVHGAAIVCLGEGLRDRVLPGAAGWYSVVDVFGPNRFTEFHWKAGAGRLVGGMPNFSAIYVLRRSLELMETFGVAQIHRRLAPHMAALRAGLERMGLEVLTPPGRDGDSGIVSFAHREHEAIGAALEKRGIVVWRGDGRVRVSVHLYNTARDVEALLGGIEAVLAEEAIGNCTKA